MRISDEVVMKHYLYQQLWEQFEELCSYASDVASHCDEMTGEMKYLCDFIEYKGLEEEYLFIVKLKYRKGGCGRNPGPNEVINRRRSRTCIPTKND